MHATVLCVVAAVLGLGAVFAWAYAEPFRARRAATLVLLVGAGLVLYTALQIVPMPAGALSVLAPHNADTWSRALTPLHEPGPDVVPISLDPDATRVQVLRGLTYVVAFLIAVRVASRRRGVVFLECAIVATGLAVAVAALLHPAFGIDKVFGIYKHRPAISPRHVAPLLNANHLAGYLNLAFCVALAMAVAPKPEVPRLVSLAAAAILVPIQIWVASRGGVATMALGAVLVLVLSRRGTSSRPVLVTWLVAGGLFLAGAGMIVLASADEAFRELSETSVSKLEVFRQTVLMARGSPFLGVGRGAFQGTFPEFRTIPGYADYTHPENIVAQWTVEWGIPVAAIAAVVLVIALRPSVALARSRPPVGSWAAIATVAIHNLVDFSSEVPAVMIALAVCAAICVAGNPEGTRARKLDQWGKRPRLVLALAVGGLAAGVLLVVPTFGKQIDDDRLALYAKARDASVTQRQFHEAARAAMLRHPAEPYFPFAGAVRALRTRDESVLPWIGRTFERARIYGPAHFLLAHARRALAGAGAHGVPLRRGARADARDQRGDGRRAPGRQPRRRVRDHPGGLAAHRGDAGAHRDRPRRSSAGDAPRDRRGDPEARSRRARAAPPPRDGRGARRDPRGRVAVVRRQARGVHRGGRGGLEALARGVARAVRGPACSTRACSRPRARTRARSTSSRDAVDKVSDRDECPLPPRDARRPAEGRGARRRRARQARAHGLPRGRVVPGELAQGRADRGGGASPSARAVYKKILKRAPQDEGAPARDRAPRGGERAPRRGGGRVLEARGAPPR